MSDKHIEITESTSALREVIDAFSCGLIPSETTYTVTVTHEDGSESTVSSTDKETAISAAMKQ